MNGNGDDTELMKQMLGIGADGKVKPLPKPSPTADYDKFIEDSANRYNLDGDLIRAMMNTESANKPKAQSWAGASGLMQLMPATAARFGVKDIWNPQQNIEGGAKYMRFLLDKFNGNLRQALAGYNAGEGAVNFPDWEQRIKGYSNNPNRQGASTWNYVNKITSRYTGNGQRQQISDQDAMRQMLGLNNLQTNGNKPQISDDEAMRQMLGLTQNQQQNTANLPQLEAQRAKLYAERSLAQGMFPQTYKKTTPQLDEIERNIEQLKNGQNDDIIVGGNPTEDNPFAGAGNTPQTQNGNVVNPSNGIVNPQVPRVQMVNGKLVPIQDAQTTQTLGGDNTTVQNPTNPNQAMPIKDNPFESAGQTQTLGGQTQQTQATQFPNELTFKDGTVLSKADENGIYTNKADGKRYKVTAQAKDGGIEYNAVRDVPAWLTGKTKGKTAIPKEFEADYKETVKIYGLDTEEFRQEYLRRKQEQKAGGRTEVFEQSEVDLLGELADTNQNSVINQQRRQRTQQVQQGLNNRQQQTRQTTQGQKTQTTEIPTKTQITKADGTQTTISKSENQEGVKEGETRLETAEGESYIAVKDAFGNIFISDEADRAVAETITVNLPKKGAVAPALARQARSAEVANVIAEKYGIDKQTIIDFFDVYGYRNLKTNKDLTDDEYFQKDGADGKFFQGDLSTQFGDTSGATSTVSLTNRDINLMKSFAATREATKGIYEAAKQGYIEQGQDDFVADLNARVKAEWIKPEVAKKEIEAYNELRKEYADYYNRLSTVTAGSNAVPYQTREEMERGAAQYAKEKLGNDFKQYGSFAAKVDENRRIAALPKSEIAKEMVMEVFRTIPNALEAVGKTLGGLSAANPFSYENIFTKALNGRTPFSVDRIDAQDSLFFKVGQGWEEINKDLIPSNPLARKSYFVTAMSGVSQVVLQGVLAYASGGVTLPAAVGLSQGFSEQQDKAIKEGATQTQQLTRGLVGAALAVPDIWLQTKWFKSLSKLGQKDAVSGLFANIYNQLASKIGKEAATKATRAGVSAFLYRMAQRGVNLGKNVDEFFTATTTIGKGGGSVVFETGQETLEGKGNQLASMLINRPFSFEELKTVTEEDLHNAVGGAFGGLGGGFVQIGSEAYQKAQAKYDNLRESLAATNIIENQGKKFVVIAGKQYEITAELKPKIDEYNRLNKQLFDDGKRVMNLSAKAKNEKLSEPQKEQLVEQANEIRDRLADNSDKSVALADEILETTGANLDVETEKQTQAETAQTAQTDFNISPITPTEDDNFEMAQKTPKAKNEITLKPIKDESKLQEQAALENEGDVVSPAVGAEQKVETEKPKINLPKVTSTMEKAKETGQTQTEVVAEKATTEKPTKTEKPVQKPKGLNTFSASIQLKKRGYTESDLAGMSEDEQRTLLKSGQTKADFDKRKAAKAKVKEVKTKKIVENDRVEKVEKIWQQAQTEVNLPFTENEQKLIQNAGKELDKAKFRKELFASKQDAEKRIAEMEAKPIGERRSSVWKTLKRKVRIIDEAFAKYEAKQETIKQRQAERQVKQQAVNQIAEKAIETLNRMADNVPIFDATAKKNLTKEIADTINYDATRFDTASDKQLASMASRALSPAQRKQLKVKPSKKETAPQKVEAKESNKQPFEMTQAEYVQSLVGIKYEDFLGRKKTIRAENERDTQFAKDTHYHKVRFAIAEGKTVPAKVLADYPSLQNKTVDEVRKDVVKQYPNLAKKYAKTAPKSESEVAAEKTAKEIQADWAKQTIEQYPMLALVTLDSPTIQDKRHNYSVIKQLTLKQKAEFFQQFNQYQEYTDWTIDGLKDLGLLKWTDKRSNKTTIAKNTLAPANFYTHDITFDFAGVKGQAISTGYYQSSSAHSVILKGIKEALGIEKTSEVAAQTSKAKTGESAKAETQTAEQTADETGESAPAKGESATIPKQDNVSFANMKEVAHKGRVNLQREAKVLFLKQKGVKDTKNFQSLSEIDKQKLDSEFQLFTDQYIKQHEKELTELRARNKKAFNKLSESEQKTYIQQVLHKHGEYYIDFTSEELRNIGVLEVSQTKTGKAFGKVKGMEMSSNSIPYHIKWKLGAFSAEFDTNLPVKKDSYYNSDLNSSIARSVRDSVKTEGKSEGEKGGNLASLRAPAEVEGFGDLTLKDLKETSFRRDEAQQQKPSVLLRNIKITPSFDGAITNAEGLALFSQLMQKGKSALGFAFKPNDALFFIEKLETLATKIQNNPQYKKTDTDANKILANIAKTVAILKDLQKTGKSFHISGSVEAVMHEKFHNLSEGTFKDYSAFTELPFWDKIRQSLLKRNYADETSKLVEEAAAHLWVNQLGLDQHLALTDNEIVQYLQTWLKQYAKEYGDTSAFRELAKDVETFKEAMMPEHYQAVKNIRGKLFNTAEVEGFDSEAFIKERDSILLSMQDESRANQSAFFSQLERTIEQKMPNKASAEQIRGILTKPENQVKKEEFLWLGLDEFLSEKDSFTKAEILDFVRANNIRVEEIVKGELSDKDARQRQIDKVLDVVNKYEHDLYLDEFTANEDNRQIASQIKFIQGEMDSELSSEDKEILDTIYHDFLAGQFANYGEDSERSKTKFSQYQLEGEKENYREIAVTAPNVSTKFTTEDVDTALETMDGIWEVELKSGVKAKVEAASRQEAKEKAVKALSKEGWKDGHPEFSDIKNPIVRLRVADRLIPVDSLKDTQPEVYEKVKSEGRTHARMLLGEEAQPPKTAEFAKMPAILQKYAYHIGVKTLMRLGSEGNYDLIGWTTGEQQADRYDLSKQVSHIDYMDGTLPDTFDLMVYDKESNIIDVRGNTTGLKESQLENVVGKDVAKRIIEGEGDNVSVGVWRLEGENLKVGGEGLKNVYDQTVPNIFKKFTKKFGAKVGTAEINASKLPRFSINDEAVNEGFAVENEQKELISDIFDTVEEAQEFIENQYAKEFKIGLNDDKTYFVDVFRGGVSGLQNEGEGGVAKWQDVIDFAVDYAESVKKDTPITVHALQITDAMRDSVMQGQPLFKLSNEASPEEEARIVELKDQDTDEFYDLVKSRVTTDGRLEINLETHELLTRILDTADFNGLFIKPNTFNHVLKTLSNFIKGQREFGANKAELAGLNTLLKNLQKISQMKRFQQTAIFELYEDSRDEERTHRALYLAQAKTETAEKYLSDEIPQETHEKFMALPIVQHVLENSPFGKLYAHANEYVKRAEIVAKFVTGQFRQLGLETEADITAMSEAVDLFAAGYIEQNASENGKVDLTEVIAVNEVLFNYLNEAQKNYDQKRNARKQGSQANRRADSENDRAGAKGEVEGNIGAEDTGDGGGAVRETQAGRDASLENIVELFSAEEYIKQFGIRTKQLQAKPNRQYRVFDKAIDLTGEDRSSADNLDWAIDSSEFEFIAELDLTDKLKANNKGTFRGAIKPTDVKIIYFEPTTNQAFNKELAKLKEQFPDVEFIAIERDSNEETGEEEIWILQPKTAAKERGDASLEKRGVVESLENRGYIQEGDITGEGAYYTKVSRNAEQAEAERKIEEIGLAAAAAIAKTPIEKASAQENAFRMAVVELLHKQASEAAKRGDELVAGAKMNEAFNVIETMAIDGTAYGQAISQLANWTRENPETIGAYVSKKRIQNNYREPLTDAEIKVLRAAAAENQKINEALKNAERQLIEQKEKLAEANEILKDFGKKSSKQSADLNTQIADLQKTVADLTQKVKDLESAKPTKRTGKSAELYKKLSDKRAEIEERIRKAFGDMLASLQESETLASLHTPKLTQQQIDDLRDIAVLEILDNTSYEDTIAKLETLTGKQVDAATLQQIHAAAVKETTAFGKELTEVQKQNAKKRAEHKQKAREFEQKPFNEAKTKAKEAAKVGMKELADIKTAEREAQKELDRAIREAQKEFDRHQREATNFIKKGEAAIKKFAKQQAAKHKLGKSDEAIIQKGIQVGISEDVIAAAILINRNPNLSENEIARGIRTQNPNLTPSQALNIASHGARFRADVISRTKAIAASAKAAIPRIDGQIRLGTQAAGKSARNLIHRIEALEKPKPAVDIRIMRIMKGLMVSALSTANINFWGGQVARKLNTAGDVLELAIRKIFKLDNPEGLAKETRFQDLLGFTSERKGTGAKQMFVKDLIEAYAGTALAWSNDSTAPRQYLSKASQVLAANPYENERLHSAYNSDIEAYREVLHEAQTEAGLLTRGVDKTLAMGEFYADKANFFNKWQEFLMRDLEVTRSLQKQISSRGLKIDDIIKNQDWHKIEQSEIVKAVNEALKITFALRPNPNSLAGKTIRAMNETIFIRNASFLLTPFANFTWNAWQTNKTYMPILSIPIAARQHQKALGTQATYFDGLKGLTVRDAVNQAIGLTLFMTALAVVRQFGDDDDWRKLRVPGMVDAKGKPIYIDIGNWFPITPFFFMANKFNRLISGKPIFSDADKAVEELIEGFAGISSRYTMEGDFLKTIGRGWDLLTEDDPQNWERFSLAGRKLAGNTLGVFFRPVPFKTMKETVQLFDDNERNLMDDADNPFTANLTRNVPFTNALNNSLFGTQPRKDLKGNPIKIESPLARMFGFNLSNSDFHRETPSFFLKRLRELAFQGENEKDNLPAAQRKRAIKGQLYQMIREAGQDTTKQAEIKDIIKRLISERVFTSDELERVEGAIGLTELQSTFKPLSINPLTVKGKAFQEALKLATPAEKAELESLYVEKLENFINDTSVPLQERDKLRPLYNELRIKDLQEKLKSPKFTETQKKNFQKQIENLQKPPVKR